MTAIPDLSSTPSAACPYCQNAYAPGQAFCTTCGAALNLAPAPVAQPAASGPSARSSLIIFGVLSGLALIALIARGGADDGYSLGAAMGGVMAWLAFLVGGIHKLRAGKRGVGIALLAVAALVLVSAISNAAKLSQYQQANQQLFPQQQFPGQTYPNQQYPNQQFPNQQYPQQQYPPQQYPNQQYPTPQYPQQAYPPQQYPQPTAPQYPQQRPPAVPNF